MLRGRIENESPPGTGAIAQAAPSPGGFPSGDQPYTTDERPVGILFYQGRESFFLPYHLLQRMRYQADKVTLVFATDTVVLDGRGLHELYVKLTRQIVARIVEQSRRYSEVSESAVLITRIDCTPRSRKSNEQQQPDED